MVSEPLILLLTAIDSKLFVRKWDRIHWAFVELACNIDRGFLKEVIKLFERGMQITWLKWSENIKVCVHFFMLRELICTTSSYFLCSSRYMTEMASLFLTVNSDLNNLSQIIADINKTYTHGAAVWRLSINYLLFLNRSSLCLNWRNFATSMFHPFLIVCNWSEC